MKDFIIAIFAGLACLTPLIKEIRQWHVAVKKLKTSAKAPKEDATKVTKTNADDSPTPAPSTLTVTEARRIVWRKILRSPSFWWVMVQFLLYVSLTIFLLFYMTSGAPRPATQHDVAMVGAIVALILQNPLSRPNEIKPIQFD